MTELEGWYWVVAIISGLCLANTSPRKDDPWLWLICIAYGIFWPITLFYTLILFISKRKNNNIDF